MTAVDVIVPVYNGAAYIERCVKSVVRNSRQCAESGILVNLIVVNDGSTDQTVAIIEKLGLNKTFLKVLMEENSGVACARNRGLDEANGDYVLFLDADDWLPEGAIEYLVESAADNNVDIAIGMSRYYVGRIPVSTTFETWHKLETGIINPHDRNFLVEITPAIRAKLFSRKLFENMRFPRERIKWEDLALVPALLSGTSRIACVDDVVYNYTVHANTTVKDFIRECNVLDIIKSLDILKENMQRLGTFADFSDEYYSMLTLHTLFRAENIVTWMNIGANRKRKLTNDLLLELSQRYPDWKDDPVLVDPIKRYQDPFFNFMLKRLYL